MDRNNPDGNEQEAIALYVEQCRRLLLNATHGDGTMSMLFSIHGHGVPHGYGDHHGYGVNHGYGMGSTLGMGSTMGMGWGPP